MGRDPEQLSDWLSGRHHPFRKNREKIERFDPAHKAKRRTDVLPLECQRAFELGQRLAGAEIIAA